MFEIKSVIKLTEQINQELIEKYSLNADIIKAMPQTNGDVSVWMIEPVTSKKSNMAFNVNIVGKGLTQNLSFTVKKSIINNILLPNDADVRERNSDKTNNYIKISVYSENIEKFVRDIIDYCINSFQPSDRFGCCSRYKECSDAKKCIHPNEFYARACWYRKNLEAGKIFY